MERSRTHRWIGWLGMLAIALTVAMPVIARLSPLPGAPTGMAGMAGMAAGGMHDGHRDPPAAPGVPVTTRCGYCDLLGHMPVLLAVASLPVLAPLPPARSGPPVPSPCWSARVVLAAAPRGPPGGVPA